tara:strand:- start:506 stop:1003 length:498 start_codon:yes stop_codon:yes gene_type:complete
MTLYVEKTRGKKKYRDPTEKCRTCGRWSHSNREGWNNFGNDMYLKNDDSPEDYFHLYDPEFSTRHPDLCIQNESCYVSINGSTYYKAIRTMLESANTAVGLYSFYASALGLPYEDRHTNRSKIRKFCEKLNQEKFEREQSRKKYERKQKREREKQNETHTVCSSL